MLISPQKFSNNVDQSNPSNDFFWLMSLQLTRYASRPPPREVTHGRVDVNTTPTMIQETFL